MSYYPCIRSKILLSSMNVSYYHKYNLVTLFNGLYVCLQYNGFSDPFIRLFINEFRPLTKSYQIPFLNIVIHISQIIVMLCSSSSCICHHLVAIVKQWAESGGCETDTSL